MENSFAQGHLNNVPSLDFIEGEERYSPRVQLGTSPTVGWAKALCPANSAGSWRRVTSNRTPTSSVHGRSTCFGRKLPGLEAKFSWTPWGKPPMPSESQRPHRHICKVMPDKLTLDVNQSACLSSLLRNLPYLFQTGPWTLLSIPTSLTILPTYVMYYYYMFIYLSLPLNFLKVGTVWFFFPSLYIFFSLSYSSPIGIQT